MKYKFSKEDHVHKLIDEENGNEILLTGTTSVLDVLAKPLTWWASGLAVQKLGWHPRKVDDRYVAKDVRLNHTAGEFKRIKGMSDEEYFNLLDEAYSAHNDSKNKSAKGGTELHQKVEDWVNAKIRGESPEYDPQIKPLVDWAERNVQQFLWSEIHLYSTEHHLGGITDIGFMDKEGRIAILDIKSSKEAYISQFIQCAGYDIQLSENGGYSSDGEKVFDLKGHPISYYAILPFGMRYPEVQIRHDTKQLKEAFLHALALSRILKG